MISLPAVDSSIMGGTKKIKKNMQAIGDHSEPGGSAVAPKKGKLKSKNFSQCETEVLAEEVVPKYSMLYGSRKANTTSSVRNQIWQNILMQVNSVGVAQRSIAQLKKKWNDLRRIVKAKMAEEAKQCKITGGGPRENNNFSAAEELVRVTYSRDQVQGVGNMDFMALANSPQDVDNPSSDVEEQATMERENLQESEVTTENPTSTPSTQQADFNIEGDLGFTDPQMSFLNAYSMRNQRNLEAIVAKMESMENYCQKGLQLFEQLVNDCHKYVEFSISNPQQSNIPAPIYTQSKGSSPIPQSSIDSLPKYGVNLPPTSSDSSAISQVAKPVLKSGKRPYKSNFRKLRKPPQKKLYIHLPNPLTFWI
ncbi:uncharacterized protein LOC130367832 isoform X2 [Hyla sarda]|uniref:uncharacterized protein LOC130367832 isoform X2 n=1 Tax=Hyla sarda TaxID=327740 RepID=UPI0024C433AE|nr:uncharacterized protein LOC130367832 isoform X2 [Hyla sarda]